jgi:hypothetical protein
MSSLGIYFGSKVISLVETKGNKLAKFAQIVPAQAISGELEEKASVESRAIEIVALLKEELRRNRIEAKRASICLSGTDLIIRNFEMPVLPREELQSAVIFEAKKYIPFRVEDIISDSQINYDKASRKNTVLFTGIKKEALDRYISIINELNIKISSIEYSAFSLIRALKLTGASDKGIIGILGADLTGQDEINFTVLEDGFPLFSRDITLAAGPEEFGGAEVKEPGMALEKLKTEVRVSLDYYQRKFPAKEIKKIFFVSDENFRSELEAFLMELGLTAQFLDLSNQIPKSTPYSLSLIKGFCVALSDVIKTNIKTDLLAAKEKAKLAKEKAVSAKEISLIKGLKLNYRLVLLGVLICIATFAFGLSKMQPIRKELNNIIGMRPKVTTVSPEASYEELSGTDETYKAKLTSLDNLVRKQLYLTSPLNVIPSAIPEGVWLTGFDFNKTEEGKADLTLGGMAYLTDSDQEFAAVNKFLANLKGNPEFAKYFKDLSVTLLNRVEVERLTMTNFSITCRSYKRRE